MDILLTSYNNSASQQFSAVASGIFKNLEIVVSINFIALCGVLQAFSGIADFKSIRPFTSVIETAFEKADKHNATTIPWFGFERMILGRRPIDLSLLIGLEEIHTPSYTRSLTTRDTDMRDKLSNSAIWGFDIDFLERNNLRMLIRFFSRDSTKVRSFNSFSS